MSAFWVLNSADHVVGMLSEADLLLKQVGHEALAGHLMASGVGGEREVGRRDRRATDDRARRDHRSAGQRGRCGQANVRPAVNRLPVVDDGGRMAGIVSPRRCAGHLRPARQRGPR